MIAVVLDPEVECLLRQMSADLDLSPEVMARVMLESAVMLSLTR